MAMQILWTALPSGFDASYYYFSVFVSHRLSGGSSGTLADYPLGPSTDPTNWAASMASAVSVSVSFGSGFVGAQVVPAGYPGYWAPPAPSIWTAIFPSTTPVEDYAASVLPHSPSARAIRTFGASALASSYESLYATLATSSASDYPSVASAPVADYVTALGGFPALLEALRRTYPKGTPAHTDPNAPGLQSTIQAHYGGPGSVADIAYQHYLAYRFYRRDTSSQYAPRSAAAVTPLAPPGLTFHKLVGMCADHPTLLRNLGLVLDCRISRGNVPTPLPSSGTLQVQVSWGVFAGPPPGQSIYPQTLYAITSDGFYAQPSLPTGEISNGMLAIPASNQYSVVQMDADGHAQKMIGYGATAAQVSYGSPPSLTPGRSQPSSPSSAESLPARRTGGLTVMKAGRADALSALFAKGDTNNTNLAANNPVVLDSSDVCRGFRIDVWDASGTATATGGPWRSLCQRSGTDVVGGAAYALSAADLEGFVKAAGATRGGPDADATEQNTLYVHEAVFGWDGWSLCARKPGRAVAYTEGDGNQNPVVIGFLANHAPAGYPVVSNYAVTPGTLPRLRFGRAYQIRVRAVDLAGNSRPPTYQSTTVDPTTACPQATYLRYEPVAAPALVLQRALTPGESLESLVIRSNPDPVDDLTKIAPGGNATAYAATAAAQAAGFLDHCDRHVAPPKTSQIMAETHGMLDGLTPQAALRVSAKDSGTFFHSTVYNVDTGTSDPLPAGELAFVPEPGPTTPGDPPASGQYVLHTLPALTLPYLPDPLADGMAIRFAGTPLPALAPSLNQGATLSYAVDVNKGWPRVTPSMLTVAESAMASITYAAAAGVFTIGLPPATLVTMRSSSSLSSTLFASTAVSRTLAGNAAAIADALAGNNWLVSPYRELTLVHAVQRPLLIPTFDTGSPLGVGRDVGWTYVLPSGTVHVDGRSTVQLDLGATWTDPVDDPANPAGPQTVDHAGHAFSLPVDYASTTVLINPVTAGPPLPIKRHELGDTKHRWVTYSPDATTRYREYFPPAVASDPAQITTAGVAQVVSVPASRRPDPMVVLYAVPTFKWSTSTDGSTVTRTGRGIRVYFDRPWYSSGDDELVGVLLGSDPSVAMYTSEWGRDPVWSSSGMAEPLAAGHFTNAVANAPQPSSVTSSPQPLSAGPFALAEDSSLYPTVVAFTPEYSAARNLWFCDIEMDPGDSYFPFVRLALVRYQPYAVGANSSSSQHLSRVVRTEFLQLVPDRTLAISYAGSTLGVTVSGVAGHNTYAVDTGVSPKASLWPTPLVAQGIGHVPSSTQQLPDPSLGGGHRVTAQVQKRPAGSSNDLLWEAAGDEIELSPYAETGYVLWAQNVNLPSSPAFSQNEYRLLVRERERYETDFDVAAGVAGGTPYGERLVYAAAAALRW